MFEDKQLKAELKEAVETNTSLLAQINDLKQQHADKDEKIHGLEQELIKTQAKAEGQIEQMRVQYENQRIEDEKALEAKATKVAAEKIASLGLQNPINEEPKQAQEQSKRDEYLAMADGPAKTRFYFEHKHAIQKG